MPLLGSLGSGGAKGFGFTNAPAATIDNIAIAISLSTKKIYPMCVATDASGNIFVGAYQDDGVDGSNQFVYLLKFSSAGVLQWQRSVRWTNGSTQFANRTFLQPNCLVVGASGNIYIGFGQAVTAGYVGWVIKYDTSGNITWQQSYRQSNGSSMTIISLALNSAETALYLGATPNIAGLNETIWLASVSTTNGAINWSAAYFGGYGWYSIAVQPNGNIAVAGIQYIGSYAAVNINQYNSSGTLQWQRKYTNSNGHVFGLGISADSSNNVYVSYGYYGALSYVNATPSGGGGVVKINNSGTEVSAARAYNNAPVYLAGTTAGDLFGWAYNDSASIQLCRWNSSLAGQWTNIITAVSPSAVRPRGVSLGQASATTWLGASTEPNGSDVGGVVYRLKRDGTGTGGGNKVASPFTVSYATGTSNILSQFGFTFATNTGSVETSNFTTGALSQTAVSASLTTNTVAL